MIKLIGALCIIFAGTMLGFYQALRLTERPRQIRQSIQAFLRLETEIQYGFAPLPDALRSVAATLTGPLSQLLLQAAEGLSDGEGGSARESWQRAVERCWANTAMKRPEREVFLRLGATLGISGREDQTKHLRLAVSQLQAEEASASEEQRRYAKMWRSLGLLAGTLIVILMY